MTCRCSILSPFRWTDYKRPSIFASDSFFTPRSNGKTQSQTASEAAQRYEDRTGKSMGSIFGISAESDRRTEAGIIERQKRQSAPYSRRAASPPSTKA